MAKAKPRAKLDTKVRAEPIYDDIDEDKEKETSQQLYTTADVERVMGSPRSFKISPNYGEVLKVVSKTLS
jgi:hypothetical protein